MEGVDRVYVSVYMPEMQCVPGVVRFFRTHRGQAWASSSLMGPMSRHFVAAMEQFIEREGIEVMRFRRGERKDDVLEERLRKFPAAEEIVFIGKAQEKVAVFRTGKRRNPRTGQSYPWIAKSSAPVNQYYVYPVDRDFRPFFLKLWTYFAYNARLCLNGHEYARRPLARKGIDFAALDNGVLHCQEPKRLQAICDGLSAEKIDALLRKWLRRLPHPYTAADRKAGYRYALSILHAEFSLTQVLDRPVRGRMFFEQVIRDNLDPGRPREVQLIFDRNIIRTTPGRFRTRIVTEGVTPSVNVCHRNTRIKQYHKEGRALRTETTINNTWASARASGCTTWPGCVRVALPPTAACWKPNE
ncbi:MAG TPA: hypothetical protein VME18_06475 [Acidobacteriaceae bacterium]|nr:hypothetical protein [Acidobacteriaceae bacterium]